MRDHRFKSAYIFGAVCPARDTGVALVVSRASTEAMNLMLTEISQAVGDTTHAAVLIDGAGWHTANDLVVPANITLVPLPPYSPELNAIERLWQVMQDTLLSEDVELRFIDLQIGCAYMYVCSKRGRTLSSRSSLKKM